MSLTDRFFDRCQIARPSSSAPPTGPHVTIQAVDVEVTDSATRRQRWRVVTPEQPVGYYQEGHYLGLVVESGLYLWEGTESTRQIGCRCLSFANAILARMKTILLRVHAINGRRPTPLHETSASIDGGDTCDWASTWSRGCFLLDKASIGSMAGGIGTVPRLRLQR